MQLNRQWIAAHIPHQGTMCLLDEVLEWNPGEIRCRTGTHRLPTNPLRTGDRLHALCGVEYAAQCIAVHGALCLAGDKDRATDGAAPVPGMLASVRNVFVHVDRLDDIPADLLVRGLRVGGDSSALLYDFWVNCDLRVLLRGRATIYLGTPA